MGSRYILQGLLKVRVLNFILGSSVLLKLGSSVTARGLSEPQEGTGRGSFFPQKNNLK